MSNLSTLTEGELKTEINSCLYSVLNGASLPITHETVMNVVESISSLLASKLEEQRQITTLQIPVVYSGRLWTDKPQFWPDYKWEKCVDSDVYFTFLTNTPKEHEKRSVQGTQWQQTDLYNPQNKEEHEQ